jgi:excisionase family DNA binding protein
MNELMTVSEVAAFLRLSKAQVYALSAHRKMSHIRIGKRIVIRKDDLMKWLTVRALQEGMETGDYVVNKM